jgi:hypothetical protein
MAEVIKSVQSGSTYYRMINGLKDLSSLNRFSQSTKDMVRKWIIESEILTESQKNELLNYRTTFDIK